MTDCAPSRWTTTSRVIAILVLQAVTAEASAQSMSSSLSAYTHGYAANAGEYAAPIDPSTRDTSGNQVIVNGVMQHGSGASMFNQQTSNGAGSTSSGAQYGVNTAIGNNITVYTQGSNNTIIVNATQTNNGAVSAGTVLNGQINLNNGG